MIMDKGLVGFGFVDLGEEEMVFVDMCGWWFVVIFEW